MPNPEKFKSEIGIEPETEEKEKPFYERPLTKEEREEFSFFIEGIRREQDEKRRGKELEMLIPYLLGYRLEEELRKEGREIMQNSYERGVLRKGGYEWKRGEEEELKVWRNYKEGEGKWPSETIILDKKGLQEFKEKLLKEILE